MNSCDEHKEFTMEQFELQLDRWRCTLLVVDKRRRKNWQFITCHLIEKRGMARTDEWVRGP